MVVGNEERLQGGEIANAFWQLARKVVVGEVKVAQLRRVDNLRWNRSHDLVHLNLHHGDVGQAKQTQRDRPIQKIVAEPDLFKAQAVAEILWNGPCELVVFQNHPL